MTLGRRELQRRRMRERLLTAALDLFAARGFEATTIDQIAARADVARQTVLNHYPAKKDFVYAWGERRRDALVAPDTPAGSAPERLRGIYAALADMNRRERRLTRMLREQMIVPQPIPDAIRHAVRDGQMNGEISGSADADPLAEVLAAIYFDTLNRWLVPVDEPFDLGDALSEKLDLALNGFARHSNEPA